MSKNDYITVRDFKRQFGIPSDEKLLGRTATQARTSSWRGMRLKARWKGDSTEYAYPVNALKKIARALGIAIGDTQAKDGAEISAKPMMTMREFRTICPGLSWRFSSHISDYCNRHGTTVEGGRKNRRYPYEVLKRYAQKEGKQVPDLPRQSSDEFHQIDKQSELPLCGLADDGKSEHEMNTLPVDILDALNESNRIARENGAKLDARLDKLETKLDKLISSAAELLAIWKGDKE